MPLQRRWLIAGAALAACLPAAASVCDSGRRQSPIDIDIGATQPASGPALQFDYRAAPVRLVNDGHTVRVRGGDSRMRLGTQTLALQQWHFHRPGGDRIAGEEFPLALHLLHRAPGGPLVSLVLLFRLGDANPAFAELLPLLPAVGEPERSTRFDPARLLPARHAHYAYTGSLTGPPCTEGVQWLVMQQVQTLSAAQLAQLATRFPVNARAVQPLHGRVVRAVP